MRSKRVKRAVRQPCDGRTLICDEETEETGSCFLILQLLYFPMVIRKMGITH